MKKVLSIIVLFLFSSYVFLYSQTEPTDTDGDGYRNISTLEHLRWVSENNSCWSDSLELDNDIDASDTQNWNDGDGWSPIGNNSHKFSGDFKGQGYKIYNLYINRPLQDYIGFFGYTKNVEIIDLDLDNSDVEGKNYVGALIGNNDNISNVSNCSTTGSIIGYSSTGGLIGENDYRSSVINCFSTASVEGSSYIGGLVGYNKGSSVVKNCYATGSVTGENDEGFAPNAIGGLVGINYSSCTISNSYSTGYVSGFSQIGGLIGYNYSSTVSNSYSTGSITCTRYSGGFVGYNYISTIEKCYSIGNVNANSGSDYIGGFTGFNYYNSSILNSFSRGSVYGSPYNASGGFAGGNSSNSNITNCYSTGYVSGTSNVGGLIGYNNTNVTDSFWDIQTSGRDNSAGGIGKTTSEMKTQSTFTDAEWNFTTIWQIDALINNGYPSFIVVTTSTFDIYLSVGWNMISSHILPEDIDMTDVFLDISESVVIVKDDSGDILIPEYSINTIGNWDTHDGYMVYSNSASTLTITGNKLQPENEAISMDIGFNYLPYLRDSSIGIETALQSIESNIVIVKDINGNIYIPAMGINTIGDIDAGKAYWVYLNSSVELTYSAND